jgi:hypothetical protein
MEESASVEPVEQEEIWTDIAALFRGAIRVTLGAFSSKRSKRWWGLVGTSDWAAGGTS